MTALEVHRQKEDELRKNDAYWQDRLVKQEKDLKKTASTLEKEYNETVRAVPLSVPQIIKFYLGFVLLIFIL